jgi:diguanylate cyclase (GGDEF)-like protein
VLTWLNLALLLVTLLAVVWANELYRRAKELARQDELTGALSRRGFIEVLGDESKRSRRYLQPITVIYVDLDDFKLVNDIQGHKTGNVVLQVVARTMRCTVREVDFIARLGGDEFALLLSETSTENVRLVLNKLHTALMEAMNANEWRVTFSIGAVTFNDSLATPEEMISKADGLMYSAKLSGKNRIEHSVLDVTNKTDHLVRCSDCRTSFAATSHTCPICKGTTLLDLQTAEYNMSTQRGVQAYITNLERELAEALRSLETTLDILTDPEKLEHSRSDFILRLCEEDVQKIAVAVGMPEGFKECNDPGPARQPVLTFRQKVSELRAFAATRRNSSSCHRRVSMSS